MPGHCHHLFRRVFARPVVGAARPPRRRFVPTLRGLEGRAVPATYTHTSAFTGDATGTLVVAVDDAKPGYEDRLFWSYHFTNGSLEDPLYNPGSGPTGFRIEFTRLIGKKKQTKVRVTFCKRRREPRSARAGPIGTTGIRDGSKRGRVIA